MGCRACDVGELGGWSLPLVLWANAAGNLIPPPAALAHPLPLLPSPPLSQHRPQEHVVIMVHSVLSGKKTIYLDGKLIAQEQKVSLTTGQHGMGVWVVARGSCVLA